MNTENKKKAGLALIVVGIFWLTRFSTFLILFLSGDPNEGKMVRQPIFMSAMIVLGAALIWYGWKLRTGKTKDLA